MLIWTPFIEPTCAYARSALLHHIQMSGHFLFLIFTDFYGYIDYVVTCIQRDVFHKTKKSGIS